MNFLVILVYFFLCVLVLTHSFRVQRQSPWYAFVNCFENENGVVCETPKTVITPFGNQPTRYRNPYPAPRIGNNFPLQINQPMLPNLAILGTAHNQQPQIESYARSDDVVKLCKDEEFRCISLHQCIQNRQLCDGQVNCVDGSDEKDCPCTSRINSNRFCDNYYDCPNGEDEIGCFGCDINSYSCYSIEGECYKREQRCDRVRDCSNGKDESDCVLLAPKMSSSPDPLIRSTDGFLYLNYRDNWYPVCFDDNFTLMREVCELELGVQLRDELISFTHEPSNYNGKYVTVETANWYLISFRKECSKNGTESTNLLLHVKCPDVCGTVTSSTNKNVNQMRIAGGNKVGSESHPWLVGLYLNGTFICGGNIIDRKWIITAAHCVYRKQKRLTKYDYLEVRAGILRQRSFAPQEQAIRVLRFISHIDYDSKSLKNDIALLELTEPLFYNRWVKPICLPSSELVSNTTDANWMWKPDANTTCSAAGWGGFTARGPYPVDNRMEVELPIVPDCDPNNAGAICAGHSTGGFDTCMGDSGGALACRSSNTNRHEFYLGGIASAGYNPLVQKAKDVYCGEPNNFATFTRTSMFAMWIEEAKLNATNGIWLRENCPGVICNTIAHCVEAYDGIVDCMHGEDETKEMA